MQLVGFSLSTLTLCPRVSVSIIHLRLNRKQSVLSFRRTVSATTQTELQTRDDKKLRWTERINTVKYGKAWANRPLGIDQALYLAQQAGIATRREIQKQIMTSPSFSPDESPFLLENFFGEEIAKNKNIQRESNNGTRRGGALPEAQEVVPPGLDKIIQKHFNPNNNEVCFSILVFEKMASCSRIVLQTFWFGGQEFLWETDAIGTNRSATVRVTLRRGSGRTKILNGRSFNSTFKLYSQKADILKPFLVTQTCGIYDVFMDVSKTGGSSGQALAAKLAIGRALAKANPTLALKLQEELIFYEDIRPRWPKEEMRKGQRAARKFRKR